MLRKDGKFVDEDFAKWAVEHNRKWSDSNLFVDSTVNSLSNCCFSGDQMTITKVSGEITMLSFRELYILLSRVSVINKSTEDVLFTWTVPQVEVFYKGNWINADVLRLPKRPVYEVVIENNERIYVTDNHINVTQRGDVKTTDLTTDDYLAFDNNIEGMVIEGKMPTSNQYDSNGDSISYCKIIKITRRVDTDEFVYCFEIKEGNEPYFTLSNGVITHNCRLKSNIENLGYFNSLGGTALKVGSVKVNTINLARIALDSKTEEEYLKNLEYRTFVCLCALDAVRHIIKRNVEKGILPNFTYGLIDFEHIYNTIGFIGIYETMKRFGYVNFDEFGNAFYTEEASRLGEKLFNTMRKVADDFIVRYECSYQINTEQIPGESAAAKLMQKDRYFYPNANIYDLPLYGNQFVPLGIKTTLQERVRVQALFDGYCNGGSILHANIDAPFDSFEKAWEMTEYIADQGVTYFAFNTKIQACENNHAFYGRVCPVCGKPVSSEYTRIAGFYTKIQTWSKERKEEYPLRRWENVNGG